MTNIDVSKEKLKLLDIKDDLLKQKRCIQDKIDNIDFGLWRCDSHISDNAEYYRSYIYRHYCIIEKLSSCLSLIKL